MLKQRIDEKDVALAYILQDPILCVEFLRNTNDLSENRDTWSKRTFKYRPYQRDLLTDRSPFVSVVGGRAIGKCLISSDRVYTTQGYKAIKHLVGKHFYVWSYQEDELIATRAMCFENGYKAVITIETQSGYALTGTFNHPVLTNNGWKLLEDIQINDRVAVLTKLPHVQNIDVPDYEPFILGAMFFEQIPKYNSFKTFQYRSHVLTTAVLNNLESLGVITEQIDDYSFKAVKFGTKGKNPLTDLFYFYNMNYVRRLGWVTPKKLFYIPEKIMEWNEKALKIFLGTMLSVYGSFSSQKISLPVPSSYVGRGLQELFLRFGIEMVYEHTASTHELPSILSKPHYINVNLVTRNKRAIYRIFQHLTLTGYKAGNLREERLNDISDFYRFEEVISTKKRTAETYVIQVPKTETYIAENIINHNSLVLEDKLLWEILNHKTTLAETAESLITTANQNQLTPVLDKFHIRCLSSPILKEYVGKGLNRQKGTMDFIIEQRNIRLHARIAGSKSENNVVGLHLPRIKIDESQIYPLNAFRQLEPVLNSWEQNTQVFTTGVPNGLVNTTLYQLDMRTPKYKKYRIPATNNPYFTYKDYLQAIKNYGGEESDLFQNLVLGKHGKGSEQVITRDDIRVRAYEFVSGRYTSVEKLAGKHYRDLLPLIPTSEYENLVAAIDTGFVDPTIINVFGLKNSSWYLIARYRLQRIEFPEQEEIIHYLHKHYSFSKIAIDIGSGGSGVTIIQSFLSREIYKDYKYKNVLHGVQSRESVVIGYDQVGQEIKEDKKSLCAGILVQMLQSHQITLNELDGETLSQVERIAKQTSMTGGAKYFIISEQGKGVSKDDHIFGSLICFIDVVRDNSFTKKKKKLGRTQ